MEHLSKVVWSEGMYLAPHHFQAQSRFFERSIQFALTSLWSNPFGFSACPLDTAAVKNGSVAYCGQEPCDLRDSFDPARASIDVMPHTPITVPGLCFAYSPRP